ncbi:hypothetical protein AK812_SmicGene44610, partial [Symbiodinium microadriaticum]
MTETVDAGKRKELQRMRRAKLMSLIASHVVPQDLDFLNEIDAMYSTAKDTTEDDDEDEIIMGDFVDELVLDDLLAEDKQEFRMVSDAVKKRRIRRVQQTWQAIKKSQQAKAEAKAKAIAKAKAKAKAKGKAKGKFGRQRMLPRKRPRAPDENGQEVRVPGRPAEVPDGQEGAEGRVPAPPADVPEVPAMPVPAAPPEVPVVPVPAQEVAGQMKYDPNPGGKVEAMSEEVEQAAQVYGKLLSVFSQKAEFQREGSKLKVAAAHMRCACPTCPGERLKYLVISDAGSSVEAAEQHGSSAAQGGSGSRDVSSRRLGK